MEIKSINIIGAGNVAFYLVHKLSPQICVRTVYSRDVSHALILAQKASAQAVDRISELSLEVDLNIICVKDDAIKAIVEQLPKSITTIHTSGAIDISMLSKFEKSGIIYPLQSISKERIASLGAVPFLIEASSASFEKELLEFVQKYFSTNSIMADSRTRLRIHLAAVFANNFTNYLLIQSKDILDKAGVDFKILEPLMIETIHKAFTGTPLNSQTGPAIRHDHETVKSHLALIEDEKVKALYAMITELIQREFNV